MDIILIPGMWLDGGAWDAVIPGLREAGHIPIAITLPGQGDDGDATLEQQLDAVLGAIDSCDGAPLVVGHSGHCTLAWMAADRRPGRVAGVVMVGGMPTPEGHAYFDAVPPVEGRIHFPGWEAFAGPDSDDLDAEAREEFARHAHPASAAAAMAPVHYNDESRRQAPVVMVCPEYSPDDVRGWIAAGHMPEIEPVVNLSMVDLDSGHWPMFSKPDMLAGTIAEIADELGR